MTLGLDDRQRTLLGEWLPGHAVVADLSWGLVDTTVLRVRDREGRDHGVKAGGPTNRHLLRETAAHERWLAPWTSRARAPQLVRSDVEARLLLTRWQPGELAQGTPAATDPGVHRQAGDLLALLHQQDDVAAVDPNHERAADARCREFLAEPHSLGPHVVDAVLAVLDAPGEGAAVVVPTHGDYSPRNWVVDDGVLGVIDLGMAKLRPAHEDLVRLAHRDWRARPDLERAFLQGYGSDPREHPSWHRTRVREAVGQAVWAHRVSDRAFEQEGLTLLEELLPG